MSKSEFVSIILPTYNRAYSIGEAIESVLAQTYANWELIISDDGSTDNTQSVVRGYCEKDSRIHYHRNPQRQGLPKNRNIGVSLSKGELIYFIEDDVVIEPDCLEILVKTFNEIKAKGIKVGGIAPRSFEPRKQGKLMFLERYVGDQKRKNMNSPALIDKWTGLMYQNFSLDCGDVRETPLVPSWSLFAKDAFAEIGGYEEKAYNIVGTYSHEETDFFVRLGKRGYKLYFQPKAVARHKHVASGGCRVSSIKYYYFYLLGHIIFLKRNFGWKSLYMVPFLGVVLVYFLIKAVIALSVSRHTLV